jgi:hypothetical protein
LRRRHRSFSDLERKKTSTEKKGKSKMAIWHSFLPFGLSIAICVFVSWKSVENQLELRADSAGARQRGTGGEEEEGEDDIGEAFAAAAATAPQTQPRLRRLRPPRTASEFRARLQTLSRMAPGPRRLARGRDLALAAERALREAGPGGGGAGGAEEEGDGNEGEEKEEETMGVY